jgi:hypothetical protein
MSLRMKSSLLTLSLAVIVTVVHVAAEGTITGKLLVRERENGDHSLLLEVESPNQVIRVEFNLPQRYTFTPGYVPSWWTFTQDGLRLTFTGDQVLRLNIRLDAKPGENLIRNLQGREVELQIGTPGASRSTTLKTKTGVGLRIRTRDDWVALAAHTFPPEFTPGRPLYGSPSPLYTDGVWLPSQPAQIDAAQWQQTVDKWLLAKARTAPEKQQRIFNWTAIFDEVAAFEKTTAANRNALPRLIYYDEWRERLFDFTPATRAVPAATCTAGITGGTPMAFTGKDACLQGCFGDHLGELDKTAQFLLDGTQPMTPQAASPTTVVVRVPDNATPGPHVITWAGVTGQLQIQILSVQGSIDQNRLWRGQSTTMRLQILGSDQPIPLKIVNRTPATIDVEGGVDQVISSSGGPVNVVTRQVKGIMKGDFTIDYSVDQPSCGAR